MILFGALAVVVVAIFLFNILGVCVDSVFLFICFVLLVALIIEDKRRKGGKLL